jgi:succinate dehydrogenase / fumarate reductase, cytochrome b subunit
MSDSSHLTRGFFSSTLGRKVVMAVTGVILFGFVIGHLVGNLLLYKGPEALNAYAEALRRFPAALWGARGVLLASVVLHIWAAVSLTRSNVKARPQGYARRKDLAATYSSRTMVWSGPLLALFIVYHLMHFTFGNAHGSFVTGDVFHNVVAGFRSPLVSGFYILAMLALGLHLYHGFYSMMQSVGANHPPVNTLRRRAAAVLALAIVAGNISFPIAVLTGIVKEPAQIASPRGAAEGVAMTKGAR